MLEIYYPANSLHLQEGDPLVLACTIKYQPHQGLHVYWCKQAEELSICDRIGEEITELEEKPLNTRSDPKVGILLLQIHQLNQSDSGNYQCRGTTSDHYVMGHYIRVRITATQPSANNSSQINTTQNSNDNFWKEPGDVFQSNKVLQMAFPHEKMFIRSVITVLIAIKITF
ncbi:uncharacterized protein LOC121927295 isoform X2 [Sceloporus undulatus]|nr:uncharacterized protein LOC121927295 isoform X2 [Sceloporus undulatus]